MQINTYLNKSVIIITDFIHKKKLLKYAAKNHIILSCKIYTVEEVKAKYLFTYEQEAIVEIMKKEKCLPAIAQMYMRLLYYLEEKEYKNEKIKHLSQLFTYLKKENLIKEDSTFSKFMKEKRIVLYALENIENGDKKWLQNLEKENNLIFIEEEKKDFLNKLYIFDTVEEEVSFTASKIAQKLKQKVDINHIKVILLNEDYKSVIQRIFYLYHIPFEIKEQKYLISYDITKYFLFLIKEVEEKEEIPFLLKENYDLKRPFLKEIYDRLINILNKYDFIKEEKTKMQMIEYACTHEKIKKDFYEDVVEVKSLYEDDIDKEDCIFILGASLSYFPTIYKDDEYLSDKEKEELGLDSSKQKNKKEERKLEYFLRTHKNIKVSYAHFSSLNAYAKSSFIEELIEKKYLFLEEKKEIKFSKDYASYLLNKELDEFVKYDRISVSLPILYKSIPSKYKTYDNKYHTVSKEDLFSYLENKITLSYTSLENFYKCQFRFYLQNILKIKEEKEDGVEQIFGSIVHKVLEELFQKEKSIEEIIDSTILSYYPKEKWSAKEEFYIEKYKKEMQNMIQILKSQKERSAFIEKYLEKEFCEIITFKDLEIKLVGKIDKVCTYKEKEKSYAMIVDYKTGSTNFDINKMYYGLGMQLFIYYYLLKKKENISFGGVYLQNVLKDILPAKQNKTYQDLLWDAYKLDGFTIKKKSIVNKLDKEEKNSYIKAMRFTKEGDFYYNAKVLEEEEIEKLLKITKEKIKEAIKQIYEGNFPINPKSIGFEKEEEQTGCKFCPYQDICYKKEENKNILPKLKNLEFLKGDVYE